MPEADHDITGIHAHYLSQQIADLRSEVKQEVRDVRGEVRDVRGEVRDTNRRIDGINGRLTTLLIAGLVAAAGLIGTLVAGFITVLQRL